MTMQHGRCHWSRALWQVSGHACSCKKDPCSMTEGTVFLPPPSTWISKTAWAPTPLRILSSKTPHPPTHLDFHKIVRRRNFNLHSMWKNPFRHLVNLFTGAPNADFWKISVWKTIRDLEFSEHSLYIFLLACLSWDFQTSKKWHNCPFLTDFYPKKVT